jgi:hypothetical protein
MLYGIATLGQGSQAGSTVHADATRVAAMNVFTGPRVQRSRLFAAKGAVTVATAYVTIKYQAGVRGSVWEGEVEIRKIEKKRYTNRPVKVRM